MSSLNQPLVSADEAPPKFVKDAGGVRKLNPEWKKWKAGGAGGGAADGSNSAAAHAASAPSSSSSESSAAATSHQLTALPVVSSIAEQQRYLGPDTATAQSYQETVAKISGASYAQRVGISSPTAESPLDALSRIFAKYEVPMGLLTKVVCISDYEFIEMIVDDGNNSKKMSGVKHPVTGVEMTRFEEMQDRIRQMLELLVFIPCPPISIHFLNRSDVGDIRRTPVHETPEDFLKAALAEVERVFVGAGPPHGGAPASSRIRASLARYGGHSAIRMYFGGHVDGGKDAHRGITNVLCKREDPARNPFTFMSCTDKEEEVEWMADAEEQAPYCAQFDDYETKLKQVRDTQGQACPWTYGMHLLGMLCAAQSPDDLDAMDESVPLTKYTLDNAIFGYVSSEQEYNYYFLGFLEAQRAAAYRVGRGDGASEMDKLKESKIKVWTSNLPAFAKTPGPARDLDIVKEYYRAAREIHDAKQRKASGKTTKTTTASAARHHSHDNDAIVVQERHITATSRKDDSSSCPCVIQ